MVARLEENSLSAKLNRSVNRLINVCSSGLSQGFGNPDKILHQLR